MTQAWSLIRLKSQYFRFFQEYRNSVLLVQVVEQQKAGVPAF